MSVENLVTGDGSCLGVVDVDTVSGIFSGNVRYIREL